VIRRALVLASLFLSCSAFATWNPSFSASKVQMTVGETRTITLQAVWSGLASSAMTSIVGRPLTLVAIGEPAPLAFTWYRGHLGDTTQPLPAPGEELTFTPMTSGGFSFWVQAAAPHGVSSAEITIDVRPPPRRQAVGRR
jgi:hypothetical protein